MSAEPQRLPFYAIAGQTEAEALCARGLAAEGFWAIRLRAPELSDAAYLELFGRLRAALKGSVALACDFRPAFAKDCPADFMHLKVSDLDSPAFKDARRRVPFILSAHSAAELDLAVRHGVQYAVLSPVFAPLSPKSFSLPALGPQRFAALVGAYPQIKIFALGGMTKTRAEKMRGSGCFGVAGISLLRQALGLPQDLQG